MSEPEIDTSKEAVEALAKRIEAAEWDRVTQSGPNKTGFCEPNHNDPKAAAAVLRALAAVRAAGGPELAMLDPAKGGSNG